MSISLLTRKKYRTACVRICIILNIFLISPLPVLATYNAPYACLENYGHIDLGSLCRALKKNRKKGPSLLFVFKISPTPFLS